MEILIKTGVKPYSDGSGYEYPLEVKQGRDGTDYIILGTERMMLSVDDWPDFRDGVEKALEAFLILQTAQQ